MVKQNEYECHSITMITNDVTLQKEKSGFCNQSNVSSIVGLTVSEIKECSWKKLMNHVER